MQQGVVQRQVYALAQLRQQPQHQVAAVVLVGLYARHQDGLGA